VTRPKHWRCELCGRVIMRDVGAHPIVNLATMTEAVRHIVRFHLVGG